MKLIDKENDAALCIFDFFKDAFQAFFEITSIFCASDELTKI